MLSVSIFQLEELVKEAVAVGRNYWDGYYDSPSDNFRVSEVKLSPEYKQIIEQKNLS